MRNNSLQNTPRDRCHCSWKREERREIPLEGARLQPSPSPSVIPAFPGVTCLPSSLPGRCKLLLWGHSSLTHTRGRGTGSHHQRCPRGRSCCSCQNREKHQQCTPEQGHPREQWPHPGHTWDPSSRDHSAGRTRSGGRRAPRVGSGDTAAGSPRHGIQEHRDPCTGSRSSRAGRPGRNHPRGSRAGCACSSHSCVGREAPRSQRPPLYP